MYIYPPLTKKLLPTTQEAMKAVQAADSETGFDPRPLLSILARIVEADLRIQALMQTRTLAVIGYPYFIKPADPKNQKAVDIASQTLERFKKAKIHHRFGVLLNALFFGVAAVKLQWNNVGGETIATSSIIPSTELVVRDDVTYRITDTAKYATTVLAPAEQHIVVSYNPLEAINPKHVGGLLRNAMWLALMKNFNWQDWGKFNETYGSPFRWASWAAGAGPDDKAAALKAAEQIGTDAYAAVPDTVKMNFIEAVRSGSIAAYENFLQNVNDEYSIRILGQTLTTELAGNTGSKAAAVVHNVVRQDLMWNDLQLIERAVNEQYIAVDFDLNEGKDVSLRPTFGFETKEKEDTVANAQVITEARAAQIPLVQEEVYEKLGFRVPAEGELTI